MKSRTILAGLFTLICSAQASIPTSSSIELDPEKGYVYAADSTQLSVSGDIIAVVGTESLEPRPSPAFVAILQRDHVGWTQVATIKPVSEGGIIARVELNGDTLVVFEQEEDRSYYEAHVYNRNIPTNDAWGEIDFPGPTQSRYWPGRAVIDGTRMFMNVEYVNDTLNWFEERSPGQWEYCGFIEESMPSSYEFALSGNTLVTSRTDDYCIGWQTFYEWTASNSSVCGEWKQVAVTDKGPANSCLGSLLILEGDIALAGSRTVEVHAPGMVRVYSRHEGGDNQWGAVQDLLPSDRHVMTRFGHAIGFYDQWMLVGDVSWHGDDRRGEGALYIFQHQDKVYGGWKQVAEINSWTAHSRLGAGISGSDGTVIVTGDVGKLLVFDLKSPATSLVG